MFAVFLFVFRLSLATHPILRATFYLQIELIRAESVLQEISLNYFSNNKTCYAIMFEHHSTKQDLQAYFLRPSCSVMDFGILFTRTNRRDAHVCFVHVFVPCVPNL